MALPAVASCRGGVALTDFDAHDEAHATFTLRGVPVELANAVRRGFSEIPTPALDAVKVHSNTSSMYDELLIHRLTFVPLAYVGPSTLMEEVDWAGRSPDGLPNAQAIHDTAWTVTLAAKNDSAEPLYLTSRDLVFQDGAPYEVARHVPYMGTPKDDTSRGWDMPLLNLGPGQEVNLEARVSVGCAALGAQYAPVAPVGFEDTAFLAACAAGEEADYDDGEPDERRDFAFDAWLTGRVAGRDALRDALAALKARCISAMERAMVSD